MIEQDGATRLLESPGVRAWNLMTEIWKSVKPWAEKVATSFGLTPQQLIAMKIMGEYGTMTMSELAQHLGCDASNVTSLVDKLETRGLVERRASEHDRRVKSLVMTPAGVDMYQQAHERFHQPPPAIGNLSPEDQEALYEIFQRALESVGARP